MYFAPVSVLLLASSATAILSSRQSSTNSTQLLTDINAIQRYWGEVTPYYDNTENAFGIQNVGLPDGCQVEQAHSFERHGSRFPVGGEVTNDERFGYKLSNWTTANSTQMFTGPLSFLNEYRYLLGKELLIAVGATQSFQAGTVFWQRYGRILYNQTVAQLTYNASYANGTARPKPVLRTTSQARIENSQINWALGFFGPSYQAIPNPTLAGADSEFDVVIIPEGGTENNTLASYDSCTNDNDPVAGYLGDLSQPAYISNYLQTATTRLQQYAPAGFSFTVNDTYAMQDICAYEYNYLGYSPFCYLFTADEWAGYETTHDIQYYYDYAWGNPTGRAQGIGYVQELIARLQDQYITVGNSSTNTTLDSNATTFPLNRPFYADFSHDDIIISILTALSVDYFKDPPSTTQYPPNPNRHFILSHLTPFAARLITEVVGCTSANPNPQPSRRQYYRPDSYGYTPSTATHKFVRMRLNNGIVPLATVRGGACANRTDGLCAMSAFLESQADAYNLSNYQYACFANWTGTGVVTVNNLRDWDGTINATYVAANGGGNGTVV